MIMIDLSKQYRLITRSDFDGLVCAVLLKELNLVNEIKFVHPKDMQDGKIAITANDITTNLPYNPAAALVIDHHLSELVRNDDKKDNYVIDPLAPSAARVVFNYFGGKERFASISEEMMNAVDKADAAYFTKQDVLYPKKWELLNFLMDPRTGLGRFKEFRISNYDLMMNLIDYCKNHNIDDILKLPDVIERVQVYYKFHEDFHIQIHRCAQVEKNLLILDLRQEEVIYPGNRFYIYANYPMCNISIHVLWGLNKQNTVLAVGKSIFKRSSNTNIGKLMLQYGGGGHENAGTCQVANDKADEVLKAISAEIIANG
jgi:nanoRNase/pAp phosphatase (c-di-AMP/oligoRNAs hydrolase)